MQLIYSDTTDLGQGFISIYRSPGDLYDWFQVATLDSGVQPDARYGPDAPGHNEIQGPYHLTEVIQQFDDEGFTKMFISIYGDGRLLVSRPI